MIASLHGDEPEKDWGGHRQHAVWERVKMAGIEGRGGFATLVCVEGRR